MSPILPWKHDSFLINNNIEFSENLTKKSFKNIEWYKQNYVSFETLYRLSGF